MTYFIDKLSDEEEISLLHKLNYSACNEGFRRGSETYHSEGYKIYHSFNHNYVNSKDYDDTYLSINDYDVRSYNREEKIKILYSFMFDNFGKEWAYKAIKYLKGKKAMARVRYIEQLINCENVEDVQV